MKERVSIVTLSAICFVLLLALLLVTFHRADEAGVAYRNGLRDGANQEAAQVEALRDTIATLRGDLAKR